MTERWKPESGEWYWYVGSDIVPYEDQWENFYLDGDYYESGNCFRTEEETKAAAEKVKALLLSLHEPEDGNSQKTPISESLQQEDCKKRTFVRPSHTTPEHYKPDPKTGEWWRSKGDDRYIVKIVDGYCRLCGKRIVKYKNGCTATLGTNIEDFLERFEKEDGTIRILEEKGPWKPKNEEFYYTITDTGNIHTLYWDGDSIDNYMLEIGNIFRTAEEAYRALHRLKARKKFLDAGGHEGMDGLVFGDRYHVYPQRGDKILMSAKECNVTAFDIWFETEADCRRAIDSLTDEEVAALCWMGDEE